MRRLQSAALPAVASESPAHPERMLAANPQGREPPDAERRFPVRLTAAPTFDRYCAKAASGYRDEAANSDNIARCWQGRAPPPVRWRTEAARVPGAERQRLCRHE